MKKIDNFTVQRLKEFLTLLSIDYGNSEKLWWKTLDSERRGVVLQCLILETGEICEWESLTQKSIACMFSIAKKGTL